MNMLATGFILSCSYRLEAGRPVIYCHGRLRDGRTFLIRDRRVVPHFFVRKEDAPELQNLRPQDSAFRTMAGEAVVRIEQISPADVPGIRDRLHKRGIRTFEADVRFASSYLIDLGIKGRCRIEGQPQSQREFVDLLFDDPNLTADEERWFPELSVLSFDIETDPRAKHLLAVSLYGCGADEVLLLSRPGQSTPAGAVGFADERTLLRAFVQRVRELDPDVLTGWNVIDFDLAVLDRLAQSLGVRLELGRGAGALRIRAARGYFGRSEAHLPGRVVLDGIGLLQGSFIRMEQYGLDAVALQVLGEGKTIEKKTGNKALEILRLFRHDRVAFVDYARTDARLAFQIVEKLKLVPLTVERSCLTGMTPERVSASVASFEFLYLTEMHRRGIVAPTLNQDQVPSSQAGGHVLEPTPGLWRNVWVFDFKSLYPSLMRTFNIDPLGFAAKQDELATLIEAPNGAAFARVDGILPKILDELFHRRERAKKEQDSTTSQAVKILMNSFYGVMGTPGCRFYNPSIANAITGFGRYFLLFSKQIFEARGYRVLYGDTDSLFVLANLDDSEAALALGEVLARQLNAEVGRHVQERWQLHSKLEVEFEKLYARLHLPAVRHGTAGARKRYVGLADGAIEYVGMEVVRRDWTDLAKRLQRGLYERLFANEIDQVRQPIQQYLRATINALLRGELDEHLVYRKGLRKPVDDYLTNTPPHVAAARKSSDQPGRSVTYVMTTDGAEPLDELRHDIDRDHYLQKQIRPIAEPILSLLDLEFDEVAGLQQQISLF